MLFKYKGKPKEGDYLLCTVRNIVNHSVFVNFDEYPRTSGMIHISEISPGRIRNIRDYVVEGKKIICMVLKVKRDRDQYDLSLRRVQVNKKRRKLEEIKHEQKSEKILELTTSHLEMDFKKAYNEITAEVFKDYEMLHKLFNEVALEDESKLAKYVKDKKLHDALLENIKLRIKPEEVEIKRFVQITSYDSEGAKLIRETFKKVEEFIKDKDVKLSYLGSSKYSVIIKSPDFESAEEIYSKIKETIEDSMGEESTIVFEAPQKGQKHS